MNNALNASLQNTAPAEITAMDRIIYSKYSHRGVLKGIRRALLEVLTEQDAKKIATDCKTFR